MEVNLETFIDTFFSFDDAVTWVDGHLDDHPKDEFDVVELRINLLGGLFRAGVSFKRVNYQLELQYDGA